MRQLVNITPCDVAPLCAPVAASSGVEIEYGPEGLPGFPGAPGATGASGKNAFTETISPFSMPAVDALAAVQVLDNSIFTVGQMVFIAGVGYFDVEAISGLAQLSLRNLGGTSALPVGALVGSGLRVTSGAVPGPDTPGNTPKRYAILAQVEDRGDDGGPLQFQYGTGASAGGEGIVQHLQAISDPDNIVTLGPNGASFRLPIGSWKVRVRAPSYHCNAFQVYLIGRMTLDVGPREILAIGNGFAGIDVDGADPQRHGVAEALVPVPDPARHLEIRVRQQSWSFGRSSPLRERALGVGSDFDNGSGVDVEEIFTTVEIEEL